MGGRALSGGTAVLAVALIATHRLADQAVLKDVPILAAEAIRGLVGGGILAVYYRQKIKSEITARLLAQATVCAFLGFLLNQTLVLLGLGSVDPSLGTLVVLAAPVLIMGFALGLKQESPSPLTTIALGVGAVATLGYYMFVVDPGFTSGKGIFFLLAASASYALGTVLARRFLSGGSSPESFASLFLILGGLGAGAMAFPQLSAVTEAAMGSAESLLLLTFDVVVATGVGTVLFFKALAHLKATTVGILLYLGLPFALGLSVLRGAPMPETLLLTVAGACVLAAVLALYADD